MRSNTRLGPLLRLVCQEREFHRNLAVGGVDFRGGAELVARLLRLAHLYIGVAQVLAKVGALRASSIVFWKSAMASS
jgi:hypothetical protein